MRFPSEKSRGDRIYEEKIRYPSRIGLTDILRWTFSLMEHLSPGLIDKALLPCLS